MVCVAILFAQDTTAPSAVYEMPVSGTVVVELPPTDGVESRESVVDEIEIQLAAEQSPVVAESEDEIVVDVIEAGVVEEMTSGAEMSDGLISLSVKDVELQAIVRMFSRLSNANIIVPDMLDENNPKRVDVNLDNVEWKPALQAILDTYDLELIEKIPGSDVYSIRTRPVDAPDPVEIKVFKLSYATVSEVVKMVDALVKQDGGQISTYPARNSIVAQGSAKLINNLEKILTAVDLPREQVFIEAKFLELSDSASEELGIDWSVLGGYQVGLQSISGTYSSDDSRLETINQFFDASGNQYESMDSAASGEWVEDENNPGEYAWFNGIDFDPGLYDGAELPRISGVTPATEVLNSTLIGQTMGATLTANDFNVVLSALKEMTGAKIVSNPKIIVANEETASIHIGAKKPNIKGTTQTAGDSQSTTVYSLDDTEPYFEDGIKVSVTPTINTENNITVRISPTLDRLDIVPTTAPDGTEYYGKSTKNIDTVFSLQSGQTAVIGGLTEATDSDVKTSVPFLGSLPFIGRLFSYSSESSQQVETIIFVTVGLANPESMHFETGLPEDSTLAMRYRAEAATERAIAREELKILETVEADRLQTRLTALRDAEKARLEEKQDALRKAEQKVLKAGQKALKAEQNALKVEQKALQAEQKALQAQAESVSAVDVKPVAVDVRAIVEESEPMVDAAAPATVGADFEVLEDVIQL
jgi:type IV pilus assembly protein PilQ